MSLTTSIPISPRKLRHDLYYFSDQKTPLVISVLSSLIERTMTRNQRITKNPFKNRDIRTRVFDCNQVPDMSIQSYLERIFRYTKVGPPVFVVSYVYIDRFCQIYPEFQINILNVHRLLITTIMVASKFVEDMNYRNSYFAKVGGFTTKEINDLEFDFLFLMDFKLHVNVSVFESYCCHLEREVSVGGGYQIERTLRCAEELKSIRGRKEDDRLKISRVML
ncbi:cyclin-U2-2-like [Impatiens glandulifera]|uniref:cyclin-U2-2-like n=1 Tax=Impatiens glandulifera TaxID=253017 RepID=UPI001FB10B8C|nr:cyclin-U2-2-like [Impatiens glandulifera]